jgi:hypothetical protein
MIRKGPLEGLPPSGITIRAYTRSSQGAALRAFGAIVLAALLPAAALAWLALSEPTQQIANDAALMTLMDGASDAAERDNANTVAIAPEPFDLKALDLRLVGEDTLELGPLVNARRYLYANADGKPLVLLGTRAWFSQDEPQWSARRIGSMRLIEWTAGGTRWVLAGDVHTRGLMRAADAATLVPASDGQRQWNGVDEAGKDGTWTSVTN